MIILIFLEEAMVNICSIKYESKPRTAEVGSLTLYFSLFLTKKKKAQKSFFSGRHMWLEGFLGVLAEAFCPNTVDMS